MEFNKDDPRCVSQTQAHFAKDLNINSIMKKYDKTGTIDPSLIKNGRPFYGDFTKMGDLQTAMAVVNKATAAWENLPVEVKIKFNQNPLELLTFVNKPENLVESVNLGLLPREMLPKPPEPELPKPPTA